MWWFLSAEIGLQHSEEIRLPHRQKLQVIPRRSPKANGVCLEEGKTKILSDTRLRNGNIVADLKMRIDGSIRAKDLVDKTARLCDSRSLSLNLETTGKEQNVRRHLHNNELEEVPVDLYAIKYENVTSIVNSISQ